MGIRLKFTLITSVLIIVVMSAVGYIMITKVYGSLENEIMRKGSALAGNFAANSREMLLTKDEMMLGVTIDQLANANPDGYAMVLDVNGRLIAHSDKKIRKNTAFNITPADKNALTANRQLMQETGDMYDITIPVIVKNTKIAVIRMGFPKSETMLTVRKVGKTIILLSVAALAGGIILSWFVVGVSLAPVEKLIHGARKVGEGDLNYRINVRSHDEIGRLAETFNEMTMKLKYTQEELKQKIEDMSALFELARKLNFTLDVYNIGTAIMGTVQSQMNAKFVVFYFVKEDDETKMLPLLSTDRENMPQVSFSPDERFITCLAADITVRSLEEMRESFKDDKGLEKLEKIGAHTCAPLMVKEKI